MPLPLTADDIWYNAAEAMDEAAFDSDSDLTPACAYCDGPMDAKCWCDQCEEQKYA